MRLLRLHRIEFEKRMVWRRLQTFCYVCKCTECRSAGNHESDYGPLSWLMASILMEFKLKFCYVQISQCGKEIHQIFSGCFLSSNSDDFRWTFVWLPRGKYIRKYIFFWINYWEFRQAIAYHNFKFEIRLVYITMICIRHNIHNKMNE